jgi:hypothetical protein
MPAALVRLWKVGGYGQYSAHCVQPIVQGQRRVKRVDFREVILGKVSNGGAVDSGAPFPLSSLSLWGLLFRGMFYLRGAFVSGPSNL